MKSVSLNCWLADKMRHSTGHPGNWRNFKSGWPLGAKHALIITRYPNRMTSIWETDGTNLGVSHSRNLFYGPLLYIASCQSFLPPSFKVLTRICRIFYVTIITTMTTIPCKLKRIQTGHLMTYLASTMGKITRKGNRRAPFLKHPLNQFQDFLLWSVINFTQEWRCNNLQMGYL